MSTKPPVVSDIQVVVYDMSTILSPILMGVSLQVTGFRVLDSVGENEYRRHICRSEKEDP